MVRTFVIFLLCVAGILTCKEPFEEDRISVLEGEPTNRIAGVVNVITGRSGECELDHITLGPSPLIIRRFNDDIGYESANYHGWHLFHEIKAHAYFPAKMTLVEVFEETGDRIVYFTNKEPIIDSGQCFQQINGPPR